MSHIFLFYHLRLSSIITWVTERKFHKTAAKHLNTTDEIYFVLFSFVLNLLKLLTTENAEGILLHIYFQSVTIVFILIFYSLFLQKKIKMCFFFI